VITSRCLPWRQNVVFDRTAYSRALIDEPHRSHASRYAVLIEDVRNDIARFEPFFASAVRVVELDRKRNASLKLVSELSPREHADAAAAATPVIGRAVIVKG
jgi:hypothetical protein